MNERMRHRKIGLLFIPVAIMIWMIGWTLLWIGSLKKHPKRSA